MQQYYTLEEAAGKLQMSADELREMAKKKQIRAFQDRGSWRFRSQDVEELARKRGLGSDAELQLGEPTRKTTQKAKDDLLPADFSLDEEVPIGREKPAGSGGSKAGTGSKSGPRSPAPRGDSDVRLVMDDDLNFPIEPDPTRGDSGSKSGKKSKTAERPNDSDVKMVPDASGSGKHKSPSDSDIRLHELPSASGRRKGEGVITEEIDLDAEEAKAKTKMPGKPGKPKVTQTAKQSPLPTSSPFELSESDFDVKTPTSKPPRKSTDSSSDFELVAFDSTKSPADSGAVPLLDDDSNVDLGGVSGAKTGNSGINLQDPADSGISLEHGGSDELEFELSLDAGSTPKPAKGKPPVEKEDSSSEFELSLDDSSDSGSSEFELSLDDSGDNVPLKKIEQGSDSEFELTLDDEGVAVEDEGKDIFEETNFDVPALEDDSGSEAVALEESGTDLEHSDFDISLDDDSSTGDQSDSQVVSLDDEEDADDAAGTVVKPTRKKPRAKPVALDDEPVLDDDELEVDLDKPAKKRRAVVEADDEDEEEEEAVAAAAPAEWGPVPAILLIPTVIVMLLVGIMGYEMVMSMFGYNQATTVGRPVVNGIAKMFDDNLPKD